MMLNLRRFGIFGIMETRFMLILKNLGSLKDLTDNYGWLVLFSSFSPKYKFV